MNEKPRGDWASAGLIESERVFPTNCIWWSWRDLNPRPQALFGQIYMFSGLFWISLPGSRSRTLPWAPVPLSLASTQGTRVAAS